MTIFLPDVNVWVALSVARHSHSADAWRWMNSRPKDAKLVFCRHTQTGLLRLLTNPGVMGEEVMTLRAAWAIYDRWMEDPTIAFYPEPSTADEELRRFTAPFGTKPASKWIGDCWLLAFAQSARASLITFDKALNDFAHKHGHAAVIPA
jgi:uncharacterized protein